MFLSIAPAAISCPTLTDFVIELQRRASKNNRSSQLCRGQGGLRVVSLREQVYTKGVHDVKHLVSKRDSAAAGEK